jgi:hypothetical protein
MMAASDDVTDLPLFVSPTPDYGVGEYAARASDTDRGESLLAMCERAADAILDVQGTVTAWEIRIALQRIGKLDGTERLDALGYILRIGSAEEYSNFVQSEVDKWRKVVKTANVHVD